jgi:hypothetical protein
LLRHDNFRLRYRVVDQIFCLRQTREVAVGNTDNQLNTRVALVVWAIQSLAEGRVAVIASFV